MENSFSSWCGCTVLIVSSFMLLHYHLSIASTNYKRKGDYKYLIIWFRIILRRLHFSWSKKIYFKKHYNARYTQMAKFKAHRIHIQY